MPIDIHDRVVGYALSTQQKDYYRQDGGPKAVQAVIHIAGSSVNVEILRRALRRLVERHEILRTIFEARTNLLLPLQIVKDSPDFGFSWHDANGNQEDVEDRLRELARYHHDLRRGPILVAELVMISETSSVLLLSIPATNADRLSMVNLFAELGRYYGTGHEDCSEHDAVQYADYSEWQYSHRTGTDVRSRQSPEVTSRPANWPFEAGTSPSGLPSFTTIRLPTALSDAIRSLAARSCIPVGALIGACVQIWWSGTAGGDSAMKYVLDRGFEELESAVGPFARCSTVNIRMNLDDSFELFQAEFVTAVRELDRENTCCTLAAFAAPVFGCDERSRVFHCGPTKLQLERVIHSSGGLDIHAAIALERIAVDIVASPATASQCEVERIADQLEQVLTSVVEAPGSSVRFFNVLGETEVQRIRSLNPKPSEINCDSLLQDQIEQQATTNPNAIALEFGDTTLSFAELNSITNQLGRYLRGLGVTPDELVGVCFERSPEMIIAVLGILKAGGAYVPLDPSTLNPGRTGIPRERLRFMVEDTRIKHVLTQTELADNFDNRNVRVTNLDANWSLRIGVSGDKLDRVLAPNNLAYAIYTSGSTGRPKAVLVEHRSVLNLLNGLVQHVYGGLNERPLRVSMNAPLGFDPSVQQIVMLSQGHTLVVTPEESRTTGRGMRDFLRQKSIDALDCTPSQLRLMCSEGILEDPHLAPQLIIVGGERLGQEPWDELANAKFTRGVNVYGLTETTVDSTFCVVKKEAPSIGRPLQNTQVHMLDGSLGLAPMGSEGAIYIGGAGVSRGFLNRPGMTAERYLPNPYGEPGSRMYETRDAARYYPDGRINFAGRMDSQIKIRSHRVELGEVESVLIRHPSVGFAVAVLRDSGQGDEVRLVAYVTAEGQQSATVDELRLFLKQWLPEYMLPSSFMFLDDLPMTANGKLDYAALPPPTSARPRFKEGPVHPRTALEQQIAEIWADVLQLETVGIMDDFLALGGHSLLAVRIYSRLEEMLGSELPPELLFRAQTVQEQACALSGIADQQSAPSWDSRC